MNIIWRYQGNKPPYVQLLNKKWLFVVRNVEDFTWNQGLQKMFRQRSRILATLSPNEKQFQKQFLYWHSSLLSHTLFVTSSHWNGFNTTQDGGVAWLLCPSVLMSEREALWEDLSAGMCHNASAKPTKQAMLINNLESEFSNINRNVK